MSNGRRVLLCHLSCLQELALDLWVPKTSSGTIDLDFR
jgi:hypothetical protein